MTGGWGGFRRGDIDEGPPGIDEAAARIRAREKEHGPNVRQGGAGAQPGAYDDEENTDER